MASPRNRMRGRCCSRGKGARPAPQIPEPSSLRRPGRRPGRRSNSAAPPPFCSGAASRTGARSTALCRIGLAAAGASSAMAGTAINMAQKATAIEKAHLFICPPPSFRLSPTMTDWCSQRKINMRWSLLIFSGCCRSGTGSRDTGLPVASLDRWQPRQEERLRRSVAMGQGQTCSLERGRLSTMRPER